MQTVIVHFLYYAYAEKSAQPGCFTAICKETLFAFVIGGKEYGSFSL